MVITVAVILKGGIKMAKKRITGDDGKEYIVTEKKPFYKKWWFIGFVIMVLFIIIGSVVEDEETPNVTDDIEATEKNESSTENKEIVSEETHYAIGETFDNGSFEFTFDYTVEEEISDGFAVFSPDGVFIVVNVTYKNIASEAQSLDNSSFKLIVDDKTYNTTTLIGESLSFEQLNPGNSAEGNIHFDVPVEIAESDGITLVFNPNFTSDGEKFEVKLSK